MNKIILIIFFCFHLPFYSYCQEYEQIFNFLFQKKAKKTDLHIKTIEKKTFLKQNYIYEKFFNDSLVLQDVAKFEYVGFQNVSEMDFITLSYNTDVNSIYQHILNTFTTTNIRSNIKQDWDLLKNGLFIFLDIKRKKIILSTARFMEFGHIYRKTFDKNYEKLLKNNINFLGDKFLIIQSMNENSPITEILFSEKLIKTWYSTDRK